AGRSIYIFLCGVSLLVIGLIVMIATFDSREAAAAPPGWERFVAATGSNQWVSCSFLIAGGSIYGWFSIAASSTSAFTPFGAAWAAFGYSFPRPSPPTPEVRHLALGCFLCLTSCVVTAIANSLMKLDALRIEAKVQQMILMDMDEWEPPPVYKRRLVGLAVVFYVLSAVFDFWSLVYISMSIRACSSGLTVPANAAVARVMLGEGLSRAQTVGSILIVLGAVSAMAFGSSSDDGGGSDESIAGLLSSARFITFVAATFPFYLLAFTVSKWSMRTHVAIDDHIPVSQAQVHKRRLRRAVALLALAFLGGYQSAVTALAGKFGAQYIAMDGLASNAASLSGRNSRRVIVLGVH
ncbi:hypothetical protein FOZ60_004999, partial [Perkinsus olseni]